MAGCVAVRSAGRGEGAIGDWMPWRDPRVGDGGPREARPSEPRRTGEPSSARLGPPHPDPGVTKLHEAH
jgi:hypothetical protein